MDREDGLDLRADVDEDLTHDKDHEIGSQEVGVVVGAILAAGEADREEDGADWVHPDQHEGLVAAVRSCCSALFV